MNIFSLGMDTLADELNRRGVYATVDNHAEWQSLADQAAANYKAGKEGPIIIIGHSLGADAVMEMADYLGAKRRSGGAGGAVRRHPIVGGRPRTSRRVLNLTQRDYAYMRRGAGLSAARSPMSTSAPIPISTTSTSTSRRGCMPA